MKRRNRWTCTVVERDNWVARATRLRKSATRRRNSEGLRASGEERMESEIMSDWKETNRLRELQEQIAAEKGIRADALRRLLAKVDEFSESHRAFGLPDDLLAILRGDLAEYGVSHRN